VSPSIGGPDNFTVKMLSDLLGPEWTRLSDEELAAYLRETDWYARRGEPK
jgi:hypothetical protein